MAFSFNNTDVTFNDVSIGGEIISATFDEQGAEIDVTNAGDTVRLYEVGTNDITVTMDIVGESTINVGDSTGALDIDWNSGGTDTLALGVCTAKNVTGSLDDKIMTTLTFRNSQA